MIVARYKGNHTKNKFLDKIKKMSLEDLNKTLKEKQLELFKAQAEKQQEVYVKQTHKISQIKKQIAQIHTITKEKVKLDGNIQ